MVISDFVVFGLREEIKKLCKWFNVECILEGSNILGVEDVLKNKWNNLL